LPEKIGREKDIGSLGPWILTFPHQYLFHLCSSTTTIHSDIRSVTK
jgi:hypothetical protein